MRGITADDTDHGPLNQDLSEGCEQSTDPHSHSSQTSHHWDLLAVCYFHEGHSMRESVIAIAAALYNQLHGDNVRCDALL